MVLSLMSILSSIIPFSYVEQIIWSKDIIVVFSSEEADGFNRFLLQHHSLKDTAPISSASIQSALLLNFSKSFNGKILGLELDIGIGFISFSCIIGGAYGLLPNMDFVNVIIRACRARNVPIFIEGYFPKLAGYHQLTASTANRISFWLDGLLNSLNFLVKVSSYCFPFQFSPKPLHYHFPEYFSHFIFF